MKSLKTLTQQRAIALDCKFNEIFDCSRINPRELVHPFNYRNKIIKSNIDLSIILASQATDSLRLT